MQGYEIQDLQEWNEKVRALAEGFGLKCFSQDFEICDSEQMISFMAYSGMPSHYPHWSYGKQFEIQKTLHDYGVSGLPYEMVINADPCIAYLMRDNTLLLHILTMAHVYGHNDFFKNNATFRQIRPELVVETFKVHADRIRSYIADPSIGLEKVEKVLDAAHALSLQCRRNLDSPKLTKAQLEERLRDKFFRRSDENENRGLKKRPEFDAEVFEKARVKIPLEPDEDILLFIRDENKSLPEWERDLLTIVHEEAQYFIPQIDTKIMNEGWASFWHKKIIEALDLAQGMKIEFGVRHSQVLAPHPGGLNPYHLGLRVWTNLEKIYDEALTGKISEENQMEYDRNGEPGDLRKGKSGLQKVFEVREAFRDTSFIQNFLTENLMRDMGLFEHELGKDRSTRIVTKVSDRDEWKAIRNTLVHSVGMGNIPVIKAEDANHQDHPRRLLLTHDYDGRELEFHYAKETLKHVKFLWGNEVTLESFVTQPGYQGPAYLWVNDKGDLPWKRK